jgi:hypothetical protein
MRLRNWVETNKNDGTPLAVGRLADLELSGGRLKSESARSLASRKTGLSVTCLAHRSVPKGRTSAIAIAQASFTGISRKTRSWIRSSPLVR